MVENNDESWALERPVAVLDGGLGSYLAVRLIHEKFPDQDILYLADRASFPYGTKSRVELFDTVLRALRWLRRYSPSAVVIASNVPSITVLDDLAKENATPLIGVLPPVHQALEVAGNCEVAVLGAASMIYSEQFVAYLSREAGDLADHVHSINASPLIELVESGEFLLNPKSARNFIAEFISRVLSACPDIAVFTLSSTHLAWLRDFLEEACMGRILLDPLESILPQLAAHSSSGSGRIKCFVTENAQYPSSAFQEIFHVLGIDVPISVIEID